MPAFFRSLRAESTAFFAALLGGHVVVDQKTNFAQIRGRREHFSNPGSCEEFHNDGRLGTGAFHTKGVVDRPLRLNQVDTGKGIMDGGDKITAVGFDVSEVEQDNVLFPASTIELDRKEAYLCVQVVNFCGVLGVLSNHRANILVQLIVR